MPTTLAVGSSSSFATALALALKEGSGSIKSPGSFCSSTSTTSLGAFHSRSGSISMATTSPSTARFKFNRPWIRTGFSIPSTRTYPSR
uniref:Putative secreted protein n=1 Tax=Anopheles darlingi TaxID=43151 RepID=A0A2M4DAH0_ANODA